MPYLCYVSLTEASTLWEATDNWKLRYFKEDKSRVSYFYYFLCNFFPIPFHWGVAVEREREREGEEVKLDGKKKLRKRERERECHLGHEDYWKVVDMEE